MSFVKDFAKHFSHGQLQISKSNLWVNILVCTYIDCYKMSYKVKGYFYSNYGKIYFDFGYSNFNFQEFSSGSFRVSGICENQK